MEKNPENELISEKGEEDIILSEDHGMFSGAKKQVQEQKMCATDLSNV